MPVPFRPDCFDISTMPHRTDFYKRRTDAHEHEARFGTDSQRMPRMPIVSLRSVVCESEQDLIIAGKAT